MKFKCVLVAVLCLATISNSYATSQDVMINEIVRQESKKASIRGINKPDLNYSWQSKRDPFRSYLKAQRGDKKEIIQLDDNISVSPPNLKVQGIVWSEKKSQTIINGKILREGDTIEGSNIAKINKNSVIVSYMNRRFEFDAPAVSIYSNKSLKNIKEGK